MTSGREEELVQARDSAVLEPTDRPAFDGQALGALAREMFVSPSFLAVLALKLVMGTLFASAYLRELFAPFVSYFVETGANPWEAFFVRGQQESFPYTPLMLVVVGASRWLASPLLPDAWEVVGCGHLLAMRLPLLLADLSIYATLCALLPHRVARVRLLYWASPVVIYVCYWHGQLDVIPTALLFLGVFATLRRRWRWGAALLGAALATKTHTIVAFPFLAVFLWPQRHLVALWRFFGLTAAVYLLAVLPVLASPAFRAMVYGSDKQARVFLLTVDMGEVSLYVCPAALLLLLLRFAAYPKRNPDLTMLYLAIAFSVFVVLVPPMPGWYLWAFPFIVYACAESRAIPLMTLPAFSACYLGYFLLAPGSDLFDAFTTVAPSVAALGEPAQLLRARGVAPELPVNVAFTIMQTCFVAIIFATYRFGVRSNAIYRVDERPTMIGVSGDSGAGKDRLTGLIAQALGVEQTTVVSGDDYHRWPRGHANWRVHTHLGLRSNKLHEMVRDAIALGERDTIQKVTYDHDTGSFTDPRTVAPTDFVFFVGLHTFVIERMRALFDLRIFMEPDEQLRLLWKLRRDARRRGASLDQVLEALERRQGDRERHIVPQRQYADLVVSFYPLELILVDDLEQEPRLGVRISARNSFQLDVLAEALRREDGLRVDDRPAGDLIFHTIELEGQLPATDVRRLVQELVPNLSELTQGHRATLLGDLNGLVQLTLLYCISQVRRWRGGRGGATPDDRGGGPW